MDIDFVTLMPFTIYIGEKPLYRLGLRRLRQASAHDIGDVDFDKT